MLNDGLGIFVNLDYAVLDQNTTAANCNSSAAGFDDLRANRKQLLDALGYVLAAGICEHLNNLSAASASNTTTRKGVATSIFIDSISVLFFKKNSNAVTSSFYTKAAIRKHAAATLQYLLYAPIHKTAKRLKKNSLKALRRYLIKKYKRNLTKNTAIRYKLKALTFLKSFKNQVSKTAINNLTQLVQKQVDQSTNQIKNYLNVFGHLLGCKYPKHKHKTKVVFLGFLKKVSQTITTKTPHSRYRLLRRTDFWMRSITPKGLQVAGLSAIKYKPTPLSLFTLSKALKTPVSSSATNPHVAYALKLTSAGSSNYSTLFASRRYSSRKSNRYFKKSRVYETLKSCGII